MSFHSKPLITSKKAAKIRKRLFKYSTTDKDGNPLSGYIKADNSYLAKWIICSNNPGCGEVTVTQVHLKH